MVLRLTACVCVALLMSVGCHRAAPPAALGPRPLPAASVPLEVEQFPRRADEVCAGTTGRVRVQEGSSIAEALRSADPGTLVLVEPGTYVEPGEGEEQALRIEQPGVCLRPVGGGTVVVRATGGQTTGILIAADGVAVEGVTLQGFRTGVALDAADGTLHDVTVERLRIERLTGDFREGLIAFGDNRDLPGAPPAVDGLLALDVVVDGADLGVSCNAGPCAHWWLEGVQVRGRGAGGEGDTAADAVAIEDGRQIVVVGSVVEAASGDGIDTKADDVVVAESRVADVARNGVKLWRGGDVLATVIDGTGADAALVGEEPGRYRYVDVLVTHHLQPGEEGYLGTWGYDTRRPVRLEIVDSTFIDNAGAGFWVPAGSDVVIRGTTFDDRSATLLDVGDERSVTVGEAAALADLGWVIDVRIADP